MAAAPSHLVLLAQARGHLLDRKSTRLNSSHSQISYAVFCLKKKNKHSHSTTYMLHLPPSSPHLAHAPTATPYATRLLAINRIASLHSSILIQHISSVLSRVL